MRSLTQGLLIGLASTLVSLAGAELLVQKLGLAPRVVSIEIDQAWGQFVSSPDPLLRYVPKAGAGDINSFGFRDREFALDKPADVFRILVIGDSIAYGFCNPRQPLRPDQTFSKQLEQRLNARRGNGPRIEVLNLGVSGYDTTQEVRFLEVAGLQFIPDLVVLSYCLNDHWDASAELITLLKNPAGASQDRQSGSVAAADDLTRFFYLHSDLARLVVTRTKLLKSGRGEAGSHRVEKGLARLKTLSDTYGFPVAMVVFPWLENFERYPKQAEHDYALDQSRRRGFHTVDLLDPFRQAVGSQARRLLSPCENHHPNAEGHRIAAEVLEGFLQQEKLLPRGAFLNPAASEKS